MVLTAALATGFFFGQVFTGTRGVIAQVDLNLGVAEFIRTNDTATALRLLEVNLRQDLCAIESLEKI